MGGEGRTGDPNLIKSCFSFSDTITGSYFPAAMTKSRSRKFSPRCDIIVVHSKRPARRGPLFTPPRRPPPELELRLRASSEQRCRSNRPTKRGTRNLSCCQNKCLPAPLGNLLRKKEGEEGDRVSQTILPQESGERMQQSRISVSAIQNIKGLLLKKQNLQKQCPRQPNLQRMCDCRLEIQFRRLLFRRRRHRRRDVLFSYLKE